MNLWRRRISAEVVHDHLRGATWFDRRHRLAAYSGLAPLELVRHVVIGVIGRMTALLALFWWLGRRRDRTADTVDAAPPTALAICFFALALCAAGPIAISPKVSGHYFLPANPMFALGFACLARGLVASRIEPRLPRSVRSRSSSRSVPADRATR